MPGPRPGPARRQRPPVGGRLLHIGHHAIYKCESCVQNIYQNFQNTDDNSGRVRGTWPRRAARCDARRDATQRNGSNGTSYFRTVRRRALPYSATSPVRVPNMIGLMITQATKPSLRMMQDQPEREHADHGTCCRALVVARRMALLYAAQQLGGRRRGEERDALGTCVWGTDGVSPVLFSGPEGPRHASLYATAGPAARGNSGRSLLR